MQEAGRLARAAAEKRRTLTAGSGQKLGGSSVSRGQDIRKVIADAAVRRTKAVKGCASGTERGRSMVEETTKNGFRTKADDADANEEAIMLAYIDLIEEEETKQYGDFYIPPSREHPAGGHGAVMRASESSKPASASNAIDLTAYPFETSDGSWTCEICTLLNPATYLCCDACNTDRPDPAFAHSVPQRLSPLNTSSRNIPSTLKSNEIRNTKTKDQKSSIKSLMSLENASKNKIPEPLGWICHQCGNFMESEWWTCARCGVMKRLS